MKDPESKFFELASWERLIRSDEWRLYLELLEDHKVYLIKECLKCVSKQDFHNAVRCEAKVEDVEKQTALIKPILKGLREGGKDGE